MKTTVLIPLYQSQAWIPNLLRNIEELSAVAQIIVSDDTEKDSTLKQLKRHFRNNKNVDFWGKRNTTPGWVAHCNNLKKIASTEYFMWLPHDDSVKSDWILCGEEALTTNHNAVMALGALRLSSQEGPEQLLLPSAENEILDPIERVTKALTRQFVTKEPGFGHSFHGVQRRDLSPDLPTSSSEITGQPHGWKADVFWSLEALTIGTFAVIEAEHLKNQHPESESSNWDLENNVSGFRKELIKHLHHLSHSQQMEIISNVWDAEATRLREINSNQQRRIRKLQTQASDQSWPAA